MESGAEFINHGGREHTYFDKEKQKYGSCFFYEQQSWKDLKDDILLGHKILQDVLGIHATGWRTPHFGTFQQPEHLKFLYGVLKELKYKFSSSTMPRKIYEYGPLYRDRGIIEVPISGTWNEPMNILDTWGFFEALDRQKEAKDYYQECLAISNFASQQPILINIYGDPSHISKEPLFFESMKILAGNTQNRTFAQIIQSLNEDYWNL